MDQSGAIHLTRVKAAFIQPRDLDARDLTDGRSSFSLFYLAFDTQAWLKKIKKVVLLVVMRGAFLGGIGILVFNGF